MDRGDAAATQSDQTDPFVVYAWVGTSAHPVTEHTAEGTVLIRHDMRGPHGLLAAPVMIAVMDCASANTRALAESAPTRIDLDLFDPADDVEEIRVRGRVVRQGRSQIFTDSRIEDARHPGRLLGYGTTCFAVSGPAPESVRFGHEPMPPSGRPITEVYGGEPRPDGGFDIPELTPALGHGRLHSGVMMVLAEAAAHELARRADPSAQVRTQHLGITLATSGRGGPFGVVPDLLGAAGGSATCAVEVRDRGDGDRLIATVTLGLRV